LYESILYEVTNTPDHRAAAGANFVRYSLHRYVAAAAGPLAKSPDVSVHGRRYQVELFYDFIKKRREFLHDCIALVA
jgi:hypothetical protein